MAAVASMGCWNLTPSPTNPQTKAYQLLVKCIRLSNSLTPPSLPAAYTAQTWQGAARCGFAPNASNSRPDSSNRLWGWQNGDNCAFKTANNEPVYYAGYGEAPLLCSLQACGHFVDWNACAVSWSQMHPPSYLCDREFDV